MAPLRRAGFPVVTQLSRRAHVLRRGYLRVLDRFVEVPGSKGIRSVKDGTIFDDPATVQKVDRITVELPHDIPGVNPEQVLSITHPKLKTTMTAGSGIKRVISRSVTRSPRRQSRRSASPCRRRGRRRRHGRG